MESLGAVAIGEDITYGRFWPKMLGECVPLLSCVGFVWEHGWDHDYGFPKDGLENRCEGEIGLYISEVKNRRGAVFKTGPCALRFPRMTRAVTASNAMAKSVSIVTRDLHASRVCAEIG